MSDGKSARYVSEVLRRAAQAFTLICVFVGGANGVQQGAGAAAGSGETQQDRPILKKRGERYLLRAGDVIEIGFPFSPEFNQKVTVQPDGYITVRGVGDRRVGGMTTPEVVEMLHGAFAGILREPVITAELAEFEQPYFIAGGQVGKPGRYEIRGDVTAAQAIGMAGGFGEKAKHSQVLLFRKAGEDWVEVRELNLKQMLNGGEMREDVALRAGDMLYVPQNRISKVIPYIPRMSMGLLFDPFR